MKNHRQFPNRLPGLPQPKKRKKSPKPAIVGLSRGPTRGAKEGSPASSNHLRERTSKGEEDIRATDASVANCEKKGEKKK